MRGHACPQRQLPGSGRSAVSAAGLAVLALWFAAAFSTAGASAAPLAQADATEPFASNQMAVLAALAPPVNSAPPTISGTGEKEAR